MERDETGEGHEEGCGRHKIEGREIHTKEYTKSVPFLCLVIMCCLFLAHVIYGELLYRCTDVAMYRSYKHIEPAEQYLQLNHLNYMIY